MSSDLDLSGSERKFLRRIEEGKRRREQNEFFDLMEKIPPEINGRLKEISHEYEPEVEPYFKRVTTQTWLRFGHLTLDEVDAQLFDYGMDFAFGKRGKDHRKSIKGRIVSLREADFDPTKMQVEIIASQILMDIADRLRKRLFTQILKDHNVPDAAILRLYPPGPRVGTLAFLKQSLDESFFFPDAPNRGTNTARIIPLPDPQ